MSSKLTYIVMAILLLFSSVAEAASYYWNVSSGDWSTPANWGGVEPTSSDYAYIQNDGIATIVSSESCQYLYLGGTGIGQSGTVQMSDGGLNTHSSIIGFLGIGNFVQSAGTNTISHILKLGLNSRSNGSYDLSGTGQLTVLSEFVGDEGTGTFTQTAGTNTISSYLYLGNYPGSNGTYNLSGTGQMSAYSENIGYTGVGIFNQSGGTNKIISTDSYEGLKLGYGNGSSGTYMLNGTGELLSYIENIGYGGTGTFNQSAGSNTGTFIYLGYGSIGNGLYNLSGTGQLIAYKESIGDSGTGIFNQSGGINQVSYLEIANKSGSSGIYNLTGGTLICNQQIYQGEGTATFNFGGGTLKGNFNIDMTLTLTGIGGDAKVDIPSSAATVGSSLLGTGSLNKLGSGTLILTGYNTFTGEVNFNGGFIQAMRLYNLGNGTALNFNGGGLKFASVFDPSVCTMTFQAGGAMFDTWPHNITLGKPIGNGGPGSLTKLGSGKLTLNALNTYTGNTIVKGGTLEFAGGIPVGGTPLIDVQSDKAIFKTVDVSKTDLNINTAALATFEVVNGTHNVGAISGSGITQVDSGANLTASSIIQGKLTIGAGSKVTINPSTATHIWDGGGADNLWTTKENWIGDEAPTIFDNLVFPTGVAHLENVNNFAPVMKFGSITISGNGFNTQGNILHSSSVEVQQNTSFQVDAININTLTIASGATITIRPIPGGPLSGQIAPVPEPSVFVLILGAFIMLSVAGAKKRL